MKKKQLITWEEFHEALQTFRRTLNGEQIPASSNIFRTHIHVYGVPKGGMVVAGFLASHFNIFKLVYTPLSADIILDDIEDSGNTKEYYKQHFPGIPFYTLFNSKHYPDTWLTFPWERDHPAGEETVEQNITRILQAIGEDPTRDGLKDTPARVVRSYKELYSGYGKDPAKLFTVFDHDGYDSMVLLKDIEFHSTCEHHMLPFYGKAHVAYIPGEEGKIVGISKLARLVDLFSKRLQVQERICEQVTNTLMEHLNPKGAACVIEASHMCMCARGVGKQHSLMVSSSLKGVFREELAVREELMNLIRKKS